MEKIESNEIISSLLKCLNELNVPGAEEANIDRVVSGRIIAQVLTQLLIAELDGDDDLWKIAGLDDGIELSKTERERNWRIINDRIPMLFNHKEYDLSSPDLWMFQVDDLLNYDVNAILRLLVIFISGAILSETQARTKISNLMKEFPTNVREELSIQMHNFIDLIKKSDNPTESSGSVEELRHYKAKLNEVCQSRDKLKKENDELALKTKELSDLLESSRKDAEEATSLRNKLIDAELKIKHLESYTDTLKTEHLAYQKAVQDAEFCMEKLKRQMDSAEETLRHTQAKNRELCDETDAMRSNETNFRQTIKEHEGKIRLLEREIQEMIQLEKRLQVSQQRIDGYVKQLAEADSLKTKISSLEQLLSNQDAQQKELSEELSRTLSRANNAEAGLESLQEQLRRDFSSRTHEKEDEPHTYTMSLHDDITNMLFQNSEDAPKSLLEVVEWKTKCEAFTYENARLISERNNDKKIHDNTISDYEAQIQKERIRAESAELERINLSKRVGEFERCIANMESNSKTLKEVNKRLQETNDKYKLYLEKSADVIRFYSEGQDSSAENLKLRNDLEKTQKELETMRLKIDQYKHESCQEQRLITSHLYQTWLKNANKNVSSRTTNGLSTGRNGNTKDDEWNENYSKFNRKTFIKGQLETSEFTASSSAI